jgi:hypothetical protein
MRKYRKRARTAVTAVQFNFDSNGFEYRKWGSVQKCKKNDWLVHNDGDTYTVSSGTFSRTYEETSPGRYIKTTPIWAHIATADGSVKTQEGETHYESGDYLVCNADDETDQYAVSARKFEKMYEEIK